MKGRVQSQNPAHGNGSQGFPGLLLPAHQEAEKAKRGVMPQSVLGRDLAQDLFDQRAQERRQVLVKRLAAAGP
jgi:hypothetical protein